MKLKMNIIEFGSLIFGLMQIIGSITIIIQVIASIYVGHGFCCFSLLLLIFAEISFIAGLILLHPFIKFAIREELK